MITFPNAKINIGLNIIEKIQDGFHSISMTIALLPLIYFTRLKNPLL
jgi:4-diphosphocytidyl-2C-methyl-D-erythritol kinase